MSGIRKRSWLRTLTVVLISTVALIAASCDNGDNGDGAVEAEDGATQEDGTDASGVDPQPLAEHRELRATVPFAGIEAFAPLYLADHFGEFEKENLSVTIDVVTPSDSIVVLSRGDSDFMASGVSAGLFNAMNGGVDVQMVAAAAGFPAESKQGYWLQSDLVPEGGVDEFDPCELEGRTVGPGAESFSNSTVLSLNEYLSQCPGLTLDDLEVSPLTGADLAAALETGAVALGFLPDPIWKDAESGGYAEFLIPFGEQPTAGFWMSSLIDEEPEVARAVVRSLIRTSRDYLQGDYHEDQEVRAALLEELGTPEDVFDGAFSLLFDEDLRFEPDPFIPGIQEVWIEVGGLLEYEEPLPNDQVVDMSLVDQITGTA